MRTNLNTQFSKGNAMRKLLAPLFAAAVLAPVLASALTYEEVDADGDGTVTLAEAGTAMPDMAAEDVASLDTDGDGSLSMEEFAVIPQ